MKLNWSKKACLLELEAKSSEGLSGIASAERLYYDKNFMIELSALYPINFRWQGEPAELVVLLFALKKLSESIPWPKWIQLKWRELENYLRDQNHLEAIKMDSLDSKRIDFFLELLFLEHFKLRLNDFLSTQEKHLGTSFTDQHLQFHQFISLLSSWFSSEKNWIYLYQICSKQVVLQVDRDILKFCGRELNQILGAHFSPPVKFVAIDL